MSQMNQENNVVAIATEDINHDTRIIEVDVPFSPEKLIVREKFLAIGKLMFPKKFYFYFDMLNKEGHEGLKNALNA